MSPIHKVKTHGSYFHNKAFLGSSKQTVVWMYHWFHIHTSRLKGTMGLPVNPEICVLLTECQVDIHSTSVNWRDYSLNRISSCLSSCELQANPAADSQAIAYRWKWRWKRKRERGRGEEWCCFSNTRGSLWVQGLAWCSRLDLLTSIREGGQWSIFHTWVVFLMGTTAHSTGRHGLRGHHKYITVSKWS